MTSLLANLPYSCMDMLTKLLINIPLYKLLYVINKAKLQELTQQVIIECCI